jgi:predicted nucleic acid-binding protein
MADEVLVDSNVYIDLLRAGRDSVATLYAWAAERDRSFAICGMIRLEVLRGIKSLKARQRVATLMDVMVNVPSDNRLWQTATDLAWNMDRKGLVIPGPDLVIAASAMRLGATVMTSDAHFSQVEGLGVIAPPEEWFT